MQGNSIFILVYFSFSFSFSFGLKLQKWAENKQTKIIIIMWAKSLLIISFYYEWINLLNYLIILFYLFIFIKNILLNVKHILQLKICTYVSTDLDFPDH